jgi:N-acetylmuramoyl-L-alanine amidase/Putative peptidoglycan binding domain
MTTLTLPKLTFIQSPNYSSRGGEKVRLIVVHDCEGSYDGSIAWFASTRSQVSAHYVLDKTGKSATQMVSTANKAWHCVDFNSVSIGVEMEGFEANGFPTAEMDTMASVVAFLLHVNGLPAQFAEAGEGKGFCRHFDLGRAGGGHDDPTKDDTVWRNFVAQVKQTASLEMPTSWPSTKGFLTAALPKDFTTTHRGLQDLAEGSLEWVQMNLNTLGVPKSPLLIDGLDSDETQGAISAFQTSQSLPATGIADPATISALKEAVRPILEQ